MFSASLLWIFKGRLLADPIGHVPASWRRFQGSICRRLPMGAGEPDATGVGWSLSIRARR